MPTGWSNQGNNIRIPSSLVSHGGNYPIRTTVTDSLGAKIQRAILFKVSTNGVSLGDFSYNTNFEVDYPSYRFPSSSLVRLNRFGASRSNINLNSGLRSSILGSSYLRNEYSVLPSYLALDKIIASGDVVSITKTIQSIIASDIACDKKIGYLSDFLGRIESFIEINLFNADQLRAIIKAATDEIANLKLQINGLLGDIDGLFIADLKIDLNRALARLEAAYAAFNSANTDTTEFKLRIVALGK